ncbi:MAG: nucleotidyltransferase family protein [Deltaproteobacteria bacterium]|nr:nucleotidyltransferase family protein [Deltaproteobacteria bacterium]
MLNPQYIILFHHFREMLKQANEAGVEMIPLKGAHLLTSVYPEEEDRGTIADVDFLVRDRDWHRARRLLRAYGFAPREHFADESNRYEQGFHFTLPNGKHFLFEVHRHLVAPSRFSIDTEGIWRRAYASDFEGIPCLRMADEDVFCHVAWHSAIHRFMNHERTLRDLELVLTHSNAAGKIIERAREWQVTRVVWLYLTLLRDRLETPTPATPLGHFIEIVAPPFYIQKMLLTLVGNGDETRFSMLHHRAQAALIWPLIFDSKRQLMQMIAHHPRLSRD